MRWLGVLVMLMVVPAGVASAAPPDLGTAATRYLDANDLAGTSAGWSGSSSTCDAGAESEASIAATLGVTNTVRDFAGLGPVTFDPGLNAKALKAALMMRAAGDLSHDPPPSWPCYSADGAEAAGTSNLAIGTSSAETILLYLDDKGVGSLGHRRWVLDPRGSVWGTGSTDATNALTVIGGPAAPTPVPELVSWPPSGFVPWPWVYGTWSAAIASAGVVDLGGAQVSVTVDGAPRTVTNVTDLGGGFGTGQTLSWDTALDPKDPEANRTVAVSITGVTVDGAPRTYAYTTTAFAVLPPDPAPFTAVRTKGGVKVSWGAAAEKSVPVTGYLVDAGATFRQTLPATAREVTIPYAGKPALPVSVIPQSRAGSPEVDPVVVPEIVATNLELISAKLRGGRLVVRAGIHRTATGRVKVTAKGAGRSKSGSAKIKKGRATVRVKLKRALYDARPLKVTLSYAGTATLKAAKRSKTFR